MSAAIDLIRRPRGVWSAKQLTIDCHDLAGELEIKSLSAKCRGFGPHLNVSLRAVRDNYTREVDRSSIYYRL